MCFTSDLFIYSCMRWAWCRWTWKRNLIFGWKIICWHRSGNWLTRRNPFSVYVIAKERVNRYDLFPRCETEEERKKRCDRPPYAGIEQCKQWNRLEEVNNQSHAYFGVNLCADARFSLASHSWHDIRYGLCIEGALLFFMDKRVEEKIKVVRLDWNRNHDRTCDETPSTLLLVPFCFTQILLLLLLIQFATPYTTNSIRNRFYVDRPRFVVAYCVRACTRALVRKILSVFYRMLIDRSGFFFSTVPMWSSPLTPKVYLVQSVRSFINRNLSNEPLTRKHIRLPAPRASMISKF